MALYLEAARTFDPRTGDGAIPFIHPLVATFALTGGRKSEILGVKVEDVSFERRTVRIRPNEYRRLKTRGSDREVPLWSQLREVLKRYIFEREEAHELLFPSPTTGKMIQDVRKQLDAIAKRAGMEEGSVRTRTFRHSYTAARLETLDHGQPVSVYRVAKELGHSSTAMIEKTYGHVGRVRHRSEEIEFRVGDFEDKLGDRLEKLREAS
jgi:integrase